ncbi:MAG: Alpha/beta hydrolase family protein [Promethearchaeota archaeon]|nr:MAG: Alpha/beta hydrolase family protein [Candidatus Lokiarchaeota archaeon]
MFLDDPRVSQVVFYPRKVQEPEDLDENLQVIKLSIHDDVLIGGILYLNDNHLPTILLFHGNGEIALDYDYFYKLFFECGVNLAVMDFRGYGFSSHEPTYTSLIKDAMPIYNRFKEYMLNHELEGSLFVQGRSLGSVCAAEIGSHNPEELKGIIFESGFASIYNMMTRLFNVSGPNITENALKEYSNKIRVQQFEKPTLIIHGTNDWIIPNSEAQLIYDSLPEDVDKKLIMIEGAGHNNIFSYEKDYFNTLKSFIRKYQ